MYVMRLDSFADGTDLPRGIKPWLVSFDPDGNDGRGAIETTMDPTRAMQFTTAVEAHALWRTPSTVLPLRDDGKPNRPLTAYTVSVEPAP